MPNILLGDDDEELTQLLQEYLHNHGIRCDCVHDGEAVIERLKSAMHDSAPYDLLVLDIMMPKIDGLSVLRQLPAISDIPVIMLTAKGEEIYTDRALFSEEMVALLQRQSVGSTQDND